MFKRTSILLVVILFIAGAMLAGEKGEEETWTGWVTDTNCGMKDDQAGHAACAKRCASRGVDLALVSSEGKLFKLTPKDKVVEHAGEYVEVKGTMEEDTIQVVSIMKVEKSGD